MNKIISVILKVMYRNNPQKLAASLCLYHYKQMKKQEASFKRQRSMLLETSAPCTLTTPFGVVSVCMTPKANLDLDRLVATIPAHKLVTLTSVRVNLVMKYLGKDFDNVVANWYNEKQVLFK